MKFLITTLILLSPSICSASEASKSAASHLPLWTVLPFIFMLLAIAILPLYFEKWWGKNLNKLWVSLILGVPVGAYFVFCDPQTLSKTGLEYFSFMILLGSLFVISGGIVVRGDIEAKPITNVAFLLLGSILASFMGTTGASMLLIRPILATNRERKYVVHTVIFFIFLVGNIGGCLTPLGDPPLFMGYLLGVPFKWTFSLAPEWLFAVCATLLVYFVFDTIMHRKETAANIKKDHTQIKKIRVQGYSNFFLLLGVVLSVAFVTKTPYREIILISLSIISWKITRPQWRKENNFNFAPIIEVGVLFFGIFLTMIPAIVLLHTRGSELGITKPSHFFWATGSLSSFLDNTPTYVTLFALGQGLKQASEIVGMPVAILKAISLGAVFFGANTYIGNAPNFMVKVIAEQEKVKMPSFFGYMIYSICILIPIFILVDIIFI